MPRGRPKKVKPDTQIAIGVDKIIKPPEIHEDVNAEVRRLVDQAFEQKEDQRRYLFPSQSLNISDVQRCHRMRYLKFKGAKQSPWDTKSLKKFHMGNVAEELIFGFLNQVPGVVYRYQQYIISRIDSRIRGKIDFVLQLFGKLFVTEMKSQDDYSFSKRIKKDNPQPMNARYVGQGMTYFDTLKLYEPELQPQVAILEEKRSDCSTLVTLSEPYEVVWPEIELDWRTILAYIDRDELPPVLPDFPAPWECKFCKVKDACKELYRKGK